MLHRRNLPHLYFSKGKYFVTYCLANSIPRNKLLELQTVFFSEKSKPSELDFQKFKRLLIKYDALLNAGNLGINYLEQKEITAVCKKTIHYPDNKDFILICYCIMPNHIHLVFELLPHNKGISKIMQSIKGISAREANRILCREGKFRQDESYDRWIRDEIEFYFIVRYVLLNPVEAGLAATWEDWENSYCNPDYLVL